MYIDNNSIISYCEPFYSEITTKTNNKEILLVKESQIQILQDDKLIWGVLLDNKMYRYCNKNKINGRLSYSILVITISANR